MKKWIHAIYRENRGFLKSVRHIGRGFKKMILGGIFQYFLKIGILFHMPRTNVLWHGCTKWRPRVGGSSLHSLLLYICRCCAFKMLFHSYVLPLGKWNFSSVPSLEGALYSTIHALGKCNSSPPSFPILLSQYFLLFMEIFDIGIGSHQ